MTPPAPDNKPKNRALYQSSVDGSPLCTPCIIMAGKEEPAICVISIAEDDFYRCGRHGPLLKAGLEQQGIKCQQLPITEAQSRHNP